MVLLTGLSAAPLNHFQNDKNELSRQNENLNVYRKISNPHPNPNSKIRRTKSQNFNVSHLGLQLS